MDTKKLSLKKIYFITGIGIAITAAAMLAALYLLTKSVAVVRCGLFFTVLIAFWIAVFINLMRKKLTVFSKEICRTLDGMMNGDIEPQKINEEETLLAKINYRLARLYEAMRENSRRVAEERAVLQELISDISHQVKMPIANLKIVNSTLLEKNVSEDKKKEFLQAISGQLDKLDFLMQAMIKMSRLETGIITLVQKECFVYETLAASLGGILLSAERKNIHVSVECPEDLIVYHDCKWTTEALFNILDNAVKYTINGGRINITAARLEMYTKIDITDTGIGIAESRHAKIFKRFYRAEEVHDIEGIGIGLYLAREIITMQGGFIKLTSKMGKGSTFSVFLPNK
jgi:signal transduction histidine kinase